MVNETMFIKFLYELCKKEPHKPVLFPTNDHWAMAISKHYKMLQEVSYLCVPRYPLVETLIDKEKFASTYQDKGFLLPKSWDYISIQNDSEISFPIIAKPKYRRISGNNNKSKKLSVHLDKLRISYINNEKELNQYCVKHSNILNLILFQKYIHGISDTMYTIGIYANQKHDVIRMFCGKKRRGFPADIGDCIIGENYSPPKHIIENTIRMVKTIQFHGIAEFEYKKDSLTNEFSLIEINPRSWSWVGITKKCNVNIPVSAYYDLIGVPVSYKDSLHIPNQSIFYIKILQDFTNCLWAYKNDYKPWQISFNSWLKEFNLIKTNAVIAEFNNKDYLISIIAIIKAFKRIIKLLILKAYN